MIGEKFGRWTITGNASPERRGRALRQRFRVRCSCGEERTLFSDDLLYNRSTGCESPRCKARWQAAEYSKPRLRVLLMEDLGKVIDRFLEEKFTEWLVEERKKEIAIEMAGEE